MTALLGSSCHSVGFVALIFLALDTAEELNSCLQAAVKVPACPLEEHWPVPYFALSGI